MPEAPPDGPLPLDLSHAPGIEPRWPMRALWICSLGALSTVVFDAALRSDPARLCTALPLALLLAAALALPGWGLAAGLRALHARRLAWPLLVGLAVLGIGGFLSNVLLVDQPFDPATCAGYAASLLAAAGAAVLVRRRRGAQTTLAPLAFAILAVVAAGSAIDRHAFPVQYPAVHGALRIALTLGSVTAACLWLHENHPSHRQARVLLVLTPLLLLALPCLPAHAVHRSLFAHQSLEGNLAARLLQGPALRWLGPALGVKRCAIEADQATLLDVRFDCPQPTPLAWARPVEPSVPSGGVRSLALVLVTVDAFRCGFGQRERPPFRDACPSLASFASQPGAVNGSVQVSYPATTRSLLDVHCKSTLPGGECLATSLGRLGYPGVAVATHPLLRLEPLMRSFAAWDESLMAVAIERGATSSRATTERALQHLRGSAHTRRFLWVHYFDPHDPYVPATAGHFTLSAESAYADELARTDAAIGDLLTAVETLAEPAAVLVTGDHGESFGEHGTTHHGYELYEQGVRVPFAAIPFHGAMLPRPAPRQSLDLAGYLRALASEEEFVVAPPRLMRTETLWGLSDGRHKLILDRSNGRVELYDLEADPDERDDVALARPERVSVLLAGIAAAL